jgi:hypothetical protein
MITTQPSLLYPQALPKLISGIMPITLLVLVMMSMHPSAPVMLEILPINRTEHLIQASYALTVFLVVIVEEFLAQFVTTVLIILKTIM